ncbi:Major facilitator-type transporter sor6 [Metarhizium anisopliae]|nr:Major facilitator-type transporter sor6 [Metarhizium anisopliae]
MSQFSISTTVFITGVSVFVLGFAIGPAVWGPLPNIATLLVLRFLAGTFGGSPLVNSGGAIADLFPPVQRGLAMTIYCVAPLLGPILGPNVGGFATEYIGLIGVIFVPETYGPVLLDRKAIALSKADKKVYISVLEKNKDKTQPSEVFGRALVLPWILLFREHIVLIASLYMAIIYGTVYMFLGAMPIVYNELRSWSPGFGGLAFLGMAVGIIIGLGYAIYDNNGCFMNLEPSKRTPESCLPPSIVGAVALPIGMFTLAWTNYPSILFSE